MSESEIVLDGYLNTDQMLEALDKLESRIQELGEDLKKAVVLGDDSVKTEKILQQINTIERAMAKAFKDNGFSGNMGQFQEVFTALRSGLQKSGAEGAAQVFEEFSKVADKIRKEMSTLSASSFSSLSEVGRAASIVKNTRLQEQRKADEEARAQAQAALALQKIEDEKARALKEHQDKAQASWNKNLGINEGPSHYEMTQDQAGRLALNVEKKALQDEINNLKNQAAKLISDNRSVVADATMEARFKREQEAEARAQARAEQQRTAPQRNAESRIANRQAMMSSNGGADMMLLTGAFAMETGVLFGAVAGLKEMFSAATDLEKALTNLRATTGASNTEMAQFRTSIAEAAAGSKFSATEVADSATMFTKVGFTADQVKESLGAVITYAQATGAPLQEATDMLTHLGMVFGFRSDQYGQIGDLLTNASLKTKLSTAEMGTALQYVSQEAADAGISMKEMTVAMTMAAESGIRSGSMLGTGSRKLIQELQDPSANFQKELSRLGISVEQIDLKGDGLIQTLKNLADAGFTADNAIRAFDARSGHMFDAMVRQLGDAERLSKVLGESGSAAKAAETQTQSLSYALSNLGSNLGLLGDASFKPMQDGLTSLIKNISEGIKSVVQFKDVLGSVATVIGAIIAAGTIASLSKLVKGLAVAFAEFAVTPLGIAVLALGAAVGGATILWEKYGTAQKQAADDAQAATSKFEGAARQSHDMVNQIDEAIKKLAEAGELKDSAKTRDALLEQFKDLAKYIDASTNSTKGFADALLKLREASQSDWANNLKGLGEQGLRAQIQAGGERKLELEDLISGRKKNFGPDMIPTGLNPEQLAAAKKELADIVKSLQDWRSQLAYIREETAKAVDPKETASRAAVTAAQLKVGETHDKLKVEGKTDEQKAAILSEALNSTELNANAIKEKFGEGQAFRDMQAARADLDKQLNDLQDAMAKAGVRVIEYQLRWLKAQETAIKAKYNDKSGNQTDESLSRINQELLTNLSAQEALSLKKAEDDARKNGAKQDEINKEKATVQMQFDQIFVKTQWEALQEHHALTDRLMKSWAESAKLGKSRIAEQDAQAADNTEQLKAAADKTLTDDKLALAKARSNYSSDPFAAFQAQKIQKRIDGPDTLALSDAEMRGGQGQLAQYRKDAEALQDALAKAKGDLITLQWGGESGQTQVNSDQLAKAEETILQAKKDIADNDKKIAKEEENLLKLAAQRKDTEEKIKEEKTYGGAVTAGFGDWLDKSGMTGSSMQTLRTDVTGTLTTAGNAFSTFSQKVMTGSGTVRQAFTSMVQSILQSLTQMASNQMAMSMFKMLGTAGSFYLGGFGADPLAAATQTPTTGLGAAWLPQGMGAWAQGGIVSDHFRGLRRAADGFAPTPTRDSVPFLLQPGEAVLRQSTVNLLGASTINGLNAMGNRAQSQSSSAMPANSNKAGTDNNVHVWVVAPDQKPTLGPKDVIATISDDILRGGQTKQLIKSVALGKA